MQKFILQMIEDNGFTPTPEILEEIDKGKCFKGISKGLTFYV